MVVAIWIPDCHKNMNLRLTWTLRPNEQFFSYIIFHVDEMIMMSTLYYTNMLGWVFIVLAHWNNSLQVDMCSTWTHYPNSEPSSLYNYSLMLYILNGKTTKFFYSLLGLTWMELKLMIYYTWVEHSNHYTIDGDFQFISNIHCIHHNIIYQNVFDPKEAQTRDITALEASTVAITP